MCGCIVEPSDSGLLESLVCVCVSYVCRGVGVCGCGCLLYPHALPWSVFEVRGGVSVGVGVSKRNSAST